MQKVIKITGNEAVVGNTEDNSFKRIPLANCYEGMIVNDIVDLFYDGMEYFILKKDTSISATTKEVASGNLNFENLIDQGRKGLNQLASTLKEKSHTNSESNLDVEISSTSEIIDGPWVTMKLQKMFTQFKRDLNTKEIWLGAAVFLGILFAASFLISNMLKNEIMGAARPFITGMENYFDINSFSINSLLIMGEIMFAGLKINMTASFFGSQSSFSLLAQVPIVIISIPVLTVCVFFVKVFHNSEAKNIPNSILFRKVMTSVLISFFIASIVLAFFSQTFIIIKMNIDILPMLFKSLLVLIILTRIIVLGLKSNKNSSISEFSSHVLRHFFTVQIMAFIMALLFILSIKVDPVYASIGFWNLTSYIFLGLGNLTLWCAYALVGGRIGISVISGIPPSQMGFDFFDKVIPGSSNWLWILIILVVITIVIDIDDLRAKLPKMQDWKLALIFSGAFTMLIIATTMIASVYIRFNAWDGYDNQIGTLTAGVSPSLIIFGILLAASFIRLTFLDNLMIVDKIKQIWLRITFSKTNRS